LPTVNTAAVKVWVDLTKEQAAVAVRLAQAEMEHPQLAVLAVTA
jgi:hypothetical protein